MDSEMPNWAFPLPPETRLHEPFVKLISTIPEIPEVIGFNQMNEKQLAEMEQREAAWQEILRDPAGQKWISDLEAAFFERSWYRSHALAEVCLLNSDWPAAAFHLTKAIEKNPSDRESIRLLMEANCITGRIEEAGRNLEQLRGSNSDERIIGIEAYLRLAAGDVPGSQKILDRHPEVQALDELSSCLKGQPEAVASRVEVLRKFPDSKCESKNFDSLNIAKEFIICALALNELGRTEDARKQLMTARDEFQREIDSRTLPYAQGLGKWQMQTQIKHLIESAEAKLAVP